MTQRPLTTQDIEQLKENGCRCDDWARILVTPNFNPAWCQDVTFSGDISIGELGQLLDHPIPKRAGLYQAHIHNCTIGNGVYIREIKNHLANYVIEEGVFIENVNTLEVLPGAQFGNGVTVQVMNEQGGREIAIFNTLTAQIAYMMVFYRHRPKLIQALTSLGLQSINRAQSALGRIGKCSHIINTGIISNVQIGPYTDIHNSQRLKNGTIHSSKEFPVVMGTDVVADDFIIQKNSHLHDGAIISRCFIGSGCLLARGFSAENSLFFANFIGFHGEAYAIFAGPHTATHHKSTLLIGAYFSFLNAGSGSNQSNHLYKLGPFHQGVVERGSKTASDSYILWPARIGVFTLVTGRHTNHCDTTRFPYSYLVEQDNETLCLPGVNLKSVGTIRDADKWPQRDKRSDDQQDIINYDLLSPYTVGKMEEGKAELLDLMADITHNSRDFHTHGVVIPLTAAEKGADYYELGIVKYLGNILVKHLLSTPCTTCHELEQLLQPTAPTGSEQWVDMAGFIAPKSVVNSLLTQIEDQSIATIEDLTTLLHHHHNSYYEWAWNWCYPRIVQRFNPSGGTLTPAMILSFLDSWIEATKRLDHYFIADAQKEFSSRSMIGFGIDGTEEERLADFTAVRGLPEENDFLQRVMLHLPSKEALRTKVQELFTLCS